MSLIRRPFWFSVGRLSVFGEPWERFAGDPLVQSQKSSHGGFRTLQLWMPGVHLIIDIEDVPEVVAGG